MIDDALKEAGEAAAQNTVKKRRRQDLSDLQSVHTDPGDNRRYIQMALHVSSLPPVNIHDANDVENRITDYFQICADEDAKPSLAGIALALGVDRRRLWEIREDKRGHYPQAVRDTLKKAVRILDVLMNEYMQNGKINPVTGIFLMKNNLEYQDKQEVVVTPKNPLGDAETPQALADRYIDLDPVALPSASDDGE